MKKSVAAACAAIMLVVSPQVASAKEAKAKPVELSQSEIAALQSKTYDVPYEILFPSVISTLQSTGYLNINASRDAGTVTAETEAKGKVIYNIIWGFGKKKRTQLASLFMEPAGAKRSKLNLKLSVMEAKSRGFGGSFSEGQPVKIGEPYQNFYTALDAEVARRSAEATATAGTR